MIDDLYSARILTLAANMPRTGRLDAPHGSGHRVAKLCGSTATVDVVLDGAGRVADYAQAVKACALGQAAAAVLGEHVIGAAGDEIEEARDDMLGMLKSGGDGPQGRFADLRMLKQVADYPARHASALVAVEAALDAVRAAERARLSGAA
ncbi:MAG: iron-sulfur cluster assembly scaffold protein [Brevundimonas sp.]|uniref:iron-sulfur cluster assembly scaffold protein n=1 Tax=Brevundimonas sp. TaxID=1871086 RepID=UPI00391B4126